MVKKPNFGTSLGPVERLILFQPVNLRKLKYRGLNLLQSQCRGISLLLDPVLSLGPLIVTLQAHCEDLWLLCRAEFQDRITTR